ncbi:reprolysin-like metallopeptidase [Empedobacter falsenii]|uniref:zinc-dependent metalloprotease n=1 Tax=Empedobacter TaxID=59734 RepID=UPI002449BC7C|nr:MULTISPECIES: zinc-dependent metalloprotease family protein [Empedobacter]MDH1882465.1 M12 family metallo-peptidase [Empedobacter sp. GD03797]MDM1042368.1 T9SS type A sorting domain-containing protein [Empedobacter brevis]MDM1136255.1 T9SS type A sorting domain-containing protein [Empedobacter sp. R750]
MRKNFTLVAMLLAMTITYAQENSNNQLKNIDTSLPNSKKIILDLKNVENQLASNANTLNKNSKLEVTLPNNKGKNEKFVLVERELLNDKMKEQFPNIKSYYGYSTSDPLKKISLGYSTAQGINAIVYSSTDKYIIEKTAGQYELIDSENLPSLKNFSCGSVDSSTSVVSSESKGINNPSTYRKYKLAIATDYQYNKYFSGTQEPTLETSIAAVSKSLTYILPIYENDLSISFQLADNLDKVTYLTAATSPFKTTGLNAEVQKQLDANIGSENYDIGILFTNLLGGGNAGYIGSVCNNTKKGSAYIGPVETNPEGFNFSVAGAHEMGHQFGANHVHARNEGYMANREIGSGVTVMGYPGVTGTHDVQNTFISQFNHYNLEQINSYLAKQTCGTTTESTNKPPIANAGKDYTIPKGTAFHLIGSANDTDNDKLTYSWEQSDPILTYTGSNFKNPSSKNTDGANFRVYEHSTNPERYFPPMENVLNSQLYSTWNTVSDIAKEMNFVLQVRDNKQGGGQIDSDKALITITEDGPFKINNINLNQSFKSGETFDLKWDVAGTNTGAINTQNVKIKLTTDEGKTFTTLLESTPNNGQASITLPSGVTAEKANIIIEAVNNIYYAASPFIAIGYEVSLSCNQFFATTPITMKDAVGSTAGITNITIPISGETKKVEDISLITDITHDNSNELVVMFAKSGVDQIYQYAWYQSCTTPNLSYKFNKFGGSSFDNCGVKDAVITGTLDLKRYENITANGSYLFRLADLKAGNIGTVNKIGIELCHRETSKLAVSDITKQNELFVYPNPTNGNFNIRMNTKTNKVTAEIINLAGQVVSTNTYNVAGNKIDQAVNATNLPKGVYLVKINDGDSTQTKKLIIK